MVNANSRACALPSGTNPYAYSMHPAILQGSRASQGHPAPATLQRFMRGESALSERCAVVRHLLTGCPQCLRVTRPIWRLGEEALGRALPRRAPALRAGAGAAGGNVA
jgi:hypothetical protein